MKKGLWLCSVMTLMLTLIIGCSSKEELKEESSDKASTDVKSELLDFYLSIANKINSADSDLNKYEGAEDLSLLTEEDKQKAAASANKVVEALKEVKVPEGLSKHNKEFEEALSSISDSYKEKGTQLSGSGQANLDKANEQFNEGSEKINGIFQSEDLNEPNLAAEVNG